MLSRKFKFTILLCYVFIFNFSLYAMERFSPKECLESSFNTRLIHKGPIFGLIPHELIIDKKNCHINVKYRRYLPKEWTIDVCREPVHVKVSSATGVDVAKKSEPCVTVDKSRNNSNFCSQYFGLLDVIQDDGLIFAEGDRDSLSTPHGRIYCTYLLLSRYLGDGVVFSRYTDVPHIFEKITSSNNKHRAAIPTTPKEEVIQDQENSPANPDQNKADLESEGSSI
jgi:hypothetical protein